MKINNRIINPKMEHWRKDILQLNCRRRNKLELIGWWQGILVTMRVLNLWIILVRGKQQKLRRVSRISSIQLFSIRSSFRTKFWVKLSELMLLLNQLLEENKSQILVVVVGNRGSLQPSNAIGIVFTRPSNKFQLLL